MSLKDSDDREASEKKVEDTQIANQITQDTYEDAWDEANAVGDSTAILPGSSDAQDAEDKEFHTEEPPIADIPPEEPPTSSSAPVSIPSPELQQPGESDEKYEQRYKTLQGIHRHDKEAWEIEKQSYLAELENLRKSARPDLSAPDESTAEDLYNESLTLTDEEKEEMARYEQDFDVVSAMEAKKRKIDLSKLRKEFQETLKTSLNGIVSQLTPVLESVHKSDQERHFASIRGAHEDFEVYRDSGEIVSWIESKPAYIQRALKETYDNGTTQDIIDLISDFKQENNLTINSNINSNSSPPNTPNTSNVLNIKKAEKKQNLTAVTTRKGAVNPSYAIAEDYEGAWDEAIRKQGG